MNNAYIILNKRVARFSFIMFFICLIYPRSAFAASNKEYKDLIESYNSSLVSAIYNDNPNYGKALGYGFIYVDKDSIPDLVIIYEHAFLSSENKGNSGTIEVVPGIKKIVDIYIVPRVGDVVVECIMKDGTFKRIYMNGCSYKKSDEVNTRNYFGTHLPKDRLGQKYSRVRTYPMNTDLKWAYSKAKVSLKLSAYWKNVYLGKPYKIKLTTNASGKAVWKSSNPSVATVDQTGKVTAKKIG